VVESSEKALQEALLGRTIQSVHRKGKQLWCTLSGAGNPDVLFHFGMTGAFSVQGVDAMQYKSFTVSGDWPPRFCKCEIVFESGVRLGFSDPRRLGRILLRASAVDESPIKNLAPDAFLSIPSAETFKTQLLARRKPVKAVLLDQNMVVSGIGNWIADEVLFQARVHPGANCDTLSDAQIEEVRAQTIQVCTHACKVNADSTQFPAGWMFHYRWGKGKETPVMPDGNRIVFETHGGRTSALIPKLQLKGQREKKGDKGDKGEKKPKKSVQKEKAAQMAKEGKPVKGSKAKAKRKAAKGEPAGDEPAPKRATRRTVPSTAGR